MSITRKQAENIASVLSEGLPYIQKFKDNSWSETFTNKDLAVQIEDNILNEARNLRLNSSK